MLGLLFIVAASPALPEEVVFTPGTMTLEELMVHANRYGSTEEKYTRKFAAQDEIMNRGTASLRYLINNTHIQNIWFWIFSRMLIEKLPADEAMPVLLDALDSDKTDVRKSALFFMSYYDTPEHAEIIQPCMEDEKLVGMTMRTLGKWRITNAAPAIASFLQHTNERIRVVAVNALRDIGDPVAVPELVTALGDPIFTVRNTAARALAVIGPAAEPALLNAYGQTDSIIEKRQILRTLCDLRSTNCIPLLEAAQSDPDRGLREDARRALPVFR